jgi:hypothetical protein
MEELKVAIVLEEEEDNDLLASGMSGNAVVIFKKRGRILLHFYRKVFDVQ